MSARFSNWSLEAIWSFIIQPPSSCGISDDQVGTDGTQSLLGSGDECGLYDALKEILLRQDDYPINVLYPPDVRPFLLRILSEHHSPEIHILACQILVQMCSKTAGVKEKLAHDGVTACLISIIKSHPIPLKASREMGEKEPPCDWEACRLTILLLTQLTSWLQSFALGSPLCIAKMYECDVIHVLMRIIDADNQNVFSHGSSHALESLVKHHCLVAKRQFMRRQASSSVCNELFGDSYKLCVSLYNGHYLLDVYDTTADTDVHVLDELYKRNQVWRYDPVTSDVDIDNSIADEEAGQWVDVLVMDVINSSYFWAVFGDDFSLLRDISRILNSLVLTEIDCRPKPGQHVIALKEQNGLPYRAQVVTLLDDGATCCVFAIDYGFIEKRFCVDLMKLPSEPKLTITGLAHLCKVMGSRQKPVSAQLIENVLGILCNLSSDNLGCCINVMLERRLVDNLIGLCTCPVPALQSLTIRCLANLCRCDAVQDQLAKSGICSTIIDAMEKILIKLHKPDCTELMESCVTLLSNLMYQSDKIKDLVVNNKGLHFLIALTGPQVPAVVQSSAVKALRVFVGEGVITQRSGKLLDDSCCRSISDLMSRAMKERLMIKSKRVFALERIQRKPINERLCNLVDTETREKEFSGLNWSESNNSSPRPSETEQKIKEAAELARICEEKLISEEIGGSQNKIQVKSDLPVNCLKVCLASRLADHLPNNDTQFKHRKKAMPSKQNENKSMNLKQEKLKIISNDELKEILCKNRGEKRCTVEEKRQISNVDVKWQSKKNLHERENCHGDHITTGPQCGDGKYRGNMEVMTLQDKGTMNTRLMKNNNEFIQSQVKVLSHAPSSNGSTCTYRPNFNEVHAICSKGSICRPNCVMLQPATSEQSLVKDNICEDIATSEQPLVKDNICKDIATSEQSLVKDNICEDIATSEQPLVKDNICEDIATSEQPLVEDDICEDIPVRNNKSSSCALIIAEQREPEKEKLFEDDDSILQELSGRFFGVGRPDTSEFSSVSVSSSESSDACSKDIFVASSGKKVNCVMKYNLAKSDVSTDDLVQALEFEKTSSMVKGEAIVCGSDTSFCTACEDIICDQSQQKECQEDVPQMLPCGIYKHYTITAARNLFQSIQSKAVKVPKPDITRDDSVKPDSIEAKKMGTVCEINELKNEEIRSRSSQFMSSRRSDSKLKSCKPENNTKHPVFESTSISTICEAEERNSAEDISQYSSAVSSVSSASLNSAKSLKACKVTSSRENDLRKQLFRNSLCKDIEQIAVEDKSEYFFLTSRSTCSNSTWKTCNDIIMPASAIKNIQLENLPTKCDSNDQINFQEISGEFSTQAAIPSESLIALEKSQVSVKSLHSAVSVTSSLMSDILVEPKKVISDTKTWVITGEVASAESLAMSDKDIGKCQHSTPSVTSSLVTLVSNISVERLEPKKIISETNKWISLYQQTRQKTETCAQPHLKYYFGEKIKVRSDETVEFSKESLFQVSFVGVANTICSFLNSAAGGSLYFGVTEEYIIQGVVLTQSHRERMQARLELMLSRFTPSVPRGTIRVFLHKVKRENLVDEIVCDSDQEMKHSRDVMKRRFVIEIRVQHCDLRPQYTYKLRIGMLPIGYVRRANVLSEMTPEDEYGFYVELFEESIVRQLRDRETNESIKP